MWPKLVRITCHRSQHSEALNLFSNGTQKDGFPAASEDLIAFHRHRGRHRETCPVMSPVRFLPGLYFHATPPPGRPARSSH